MHPRCSVWRSQQPRLNLTRSCRQTLNAHTCVIGPFAAILIILYRNLDSPIALGTPADAILRRSLTIQCALALTLTSALSLNKFARTINTAIATCSTAASLKALGCCYQQKPRYMLGKALSSMLQ